MTPINAEIQVKNLDHLGLIAGIIDELEIVEIINEQVGIQPGEIVSAELIVKGLTNIFLLIALAAAKKYNISTNYSHKDRYILFCAGKI